MPTITLTLDTAPAPAHTHEDVKDLARVVRGYAYGAFGHHCDPTAYPQTCQDRAALTTAREWLDAGHTHDAAVEWLEVGAFDAANAMGLAAAGLTPSQCDEPAPLRDYAGTIAYAVCNGDLSVDSALSAVG